MPNCPCGLQSGDLSRADACLFHDVLIMMILPSIIHTFLARMGGRIVVGKDIAGVGNALFFLWDHDGWLSKGGDDGGGNFS